MIDENKKKTDPQAGHGVNETHDFAGGLDTCAGDKEGTAEESHGTDVRLARPENSSKYAEFGRFQIQLEIGRGAFGVVYRAHDSQLERTVALKLPRFSAAKSSKQISRFLRESRAAANLHHPNIVAVYDAGKLGNNYYIATAFIEGSTLRNLIRKQGRPSQETAARLVASLADALDYAHQNGIVHRDIKPENILLNRSGNPFLADFGLARRMDDDVLATVDGSMLGTPAYMSPEQAEGKQREVDGRSDLWSLGVIFYELLGGKRPFDGAQIQILYSIRHDDPPPLRAIDTKIHVDLQTICGKALMKDPRERYQTCGELRDDLERWIRDEPILARRQGLVERYQRWQRRNPQLARVTTAFVVALALGGMGISWQWYRAETHRFAAEQSAKEAGVLQQQAEANARQVSLQKELVEKANQALADDKQLLESQKAEISRQLEVLELKDKQLRQEAEATQIAQKSAADETQKRKLEETKNAELRYFGEIYAARSALTAGNLKTCRELLASTAVEQRSVEYSILSRLASSGTDYKLITKISELVEQTTESAPQAVLKTQQMWNSYLGAHTPLSMTAERALTTLPELNNLRSVDSAGNLVLTVSPSSNWLQSILPGNFVYEPNGPFIPELETTAINFVPKLKLLNSLPTSQSWLSPDGSFLIFVSPTTESDKDRLEIGVNISVMRLEGSKSEDELGQSTLLRKPVGEIVLSAFSQNAQLLPPDFFNSQENTLDLAAYTKLKKVSFSQWPVFAACFSQDSAKLIPANHRNFYVGTAVPSPGNIVGDSFVDAQHLSLKACTPNSWKAVDLDSLNGLWIRVQRMVLTANTTFMLGEQRFHFTIPDSGWPTQ